MACSCAAAAAAAAWRAKALLSACTVGDTAGGKLLQGEADPAGELPGLGPTKKAARSLRSLSPSMTLAAACL